MRKLRLHLLVAILAIAGLGTGNALAGAWEDILKAADENNTDVVVQFLGRGMDVNTSDRTGTTLLMIAARNGNEPLVDILLRNRANPLKRNKFGDSAILLATMAGKLEIVKRLVDHGVPIGGVGWQPLHYATVAGRAEVASYLLSKGAPIDAKAPNGRTPLMLAVQEGQLPIAKLLVESGANLSLTDGEGRTAFALAAARGNSEMADLLKEDGRAKP